MTTTVKEALSRLDNFLSDPLEMRPCDACGCVFAIDQDGPDLLWIDRYMNDLDHECECHDFEHVDERGEV